MTLITHSGSFHADDVTACAILTSLSRYTYTNIVRTRDSEIIRNATPRDIVFDVGMICDPENNRFDHHMPKTDPTKPYREDGTPYSSVGLIWKHFGKELIRELHPNLSEESVDKVWAKTDSSLIHNIDLIDNGQTHGFAPDDFTALIDDFNPSWDDKRTDEDDAFRDAVLFTENIIKTRIERIASRTRAHDLVVEAIYDSPDNRYFILPQSMPWQGTVFDSGFDDLLYVVDKREEGWYCNTVRLSKDTFDNRKSFPVEWAGLRDQDLAAVTGVEDAIFCHPALFICGARSEEGIMSLLKQALEYEPAPTNKI